MPASERHRGPTAAQHRRMHVLWRLAGVTSRADRLALTVALVRRPLVTSNDMTEHEAWSLITYMTELDKQGRLRSAAQGWLATQRNGVQR